MFTGFTEETYAFFWDLAFHNSREFMEANRARYREHVYLPLVALTEEILPAALELDPRFNARPQSCVSRINRDTRYSKDKSPYRDHAWIAFRMPGTYLSDNFCLYAEINRDSYGYGVGMYGPNPPMMAAFRERMLAHPDEFLRLAERKAMTDVFRLEGEEYRKVRFPHEDGRLEPYLNRKNLGFCFSSADLKRTFVPELADEIRSGFALLRPVYRFLMGLQPTE